MTTTDIPGETIYFQDAMVDVVRASDYTLDQFTIEITRSLGENFCYSRHELINDREALEYIAYVQAWRLAHGVFISEDDEGAQNAVDYADGNGWGGYD